MFDKYFLWVLVVVGLGSVLMELAENHGLIESALIATIGVVCFWIGEGKNV